MAGEWTVQPLEDCMEALIDYRGKTPKKSSCGIPLITAKVVKGGRIGDPDEFIAADDYEPWMRRGIPQAGDVLITTEAPLGEVAQLGSERVALAQRLIALRGKPGVLDNAFLKFLLQTEDVQDQLRARATGTTVLGIKQSELRKVLLTLPSLPEQRAIAHILGTLDDKIELNRRMNETLEAMARALFKSWFVDFLPVRAKQRARTQTGDRVRSKAEGRLPAEASARAGDTGLPKSLADLFPSRLVDSELGEIPDGWEVGKVGNAGYVICGKTPPTQVAEYYGDDVPFITIPDMHGRIFATATQKRLSHAGAASQRGKMLPAGAICVSCIATPGLVVIASEPAQTNQQINAVVPTRSDETTFWFWALRSLGDEIRAGGSGGSVLANLSTGRFADLNVLSPPSRLRSAYHLYVAPLFARILMREWESRTLIALRDALLPRLISGQLRVEQRNQSALEASA